MPTIIEGPMIEGTVTISIEDFHNYQLFEKAVKERKVIGITNIYGYKQARFDYFLTTESDALANAESVLAEAEKENNRLESTIRDLRKEIDHLVRKQIKRERKWWHL
jgi:peptidoglycan hydrolase CwlO-like protein